ncbi:MAG: hypothetical protein HC826_02000, partial [Rhodospirillales bacterium]|nr:hypothetical protein [Rhodospirillales bacterium]
TVCLPGGQPPLLWRADASSPLSLVLLDSASGREGSVSLDTGEQTAEWPDSLPLADNSEYAIRDADATSGDVDDRRLFFRLIPDDRTDQIQQVAWMSDAGCVRQARLLLIQVAG